MSSRGALRLGKYLVPSFSKLVFALLHYKILRTKFWASLVAQWLRIHLPMQGTQFEPWSGKIPRATEQLSPVCHNY